MHLIREGQFSVASTLLNESAAAGHPITIPSHLESDFRSLYDILTSLAAHDLGPAIQWAHSRASQLEHRGSNLEFELCKLQFITLFLGTLPDCTPALSYIRSEFVRFQAKHLKEISQLFLAFAYKYEIAAQQEQQQLGMVDSGKGAPGGGGRYPYPEVFHNVQGRWDEIGKMFTREYCGLLGLSAESPLFLAVTAGGVALPVLEKLRRITEEKGTEWTSHGELPVCPLPTTPIHGGFMLSPLFFRSKSRSPLRVIISTASLSALSPKTRPQKIILR